MEVKKSSYEETWTAAKNYFDGDELAAKVFLDKYALRNEEGDFLEKTPENMHRRLASEFARIEKKKFKLPLNEDEIFSYFDKFKYIIPQGSPMYGIGNNYSITSLSNCYVLETPEDSYGSIMKTDEQLVQISKRRGGVGIDLSKIRPINSPTKNSARSSTGIVPFMERYSNSIREVGQQQRRGALMLTLNVHHPEVMNFITVKNDRTKVTGANISLKLTREFLNAVKNDGDYELRFPVDYRETGVKPLITQTIKAKEVWKAIVKNAHDHAEPGLLMWDNVLEYGPADCYQEYKSVSTNPCVTGETRILVRGKFGSPVSKRIDKLVGKKVDIWNGEEWSEVEPKITGYDKPVIKISTDQGKSLTCTHLHAFILENGDRVKAIDLKIGDKLIDANIPGHTKCQGGRIAKIEDKGIAKVVYCFTERKKHSGVFNEILTGQCSEIPLSSFDSCRLICMNLLSYVKNPFKENASFDYKKFHEHAKITQRFMDDMVDLESEKIDKIIAKIKDDPESMEIKDRELKLWQKIRKFNDEGRRTGTGITALGDTLAALGMKYGSEESIKKTEKIYRTLKLACYESSVEMAEELGAFKCWDYEKEKDNPYLLRINEENPELYKKMKKIGRRNISLTTTAPTGSVSILTQTSSGIEPVFQLSYTRRKKINVGSDNKNERVDFVDQTGDKWQEFKVYHHQLKKWMEITGETDEKKSPWFGCCAEDLNWINRVDLQAAAQLHICHALSSTINLPENVSEETVAKIYETAFEKGLKGLTIYRKNCRSGVLVDNKPTIDNKITNIPKTKAPKRPKELKGEVHHFNLNKQKYYVVVGLWSNGDPYEIFTGINHNDEGDTIIPKTVKEGMMSKESSGKYNLISGENIWHLTNGHSDDSADALTRLISTALRHGSPLSFIVEQLLKTKGPMITFSKVLARTLKKYITDGTASTEKCPDCKTQMIFAEGCCRCNICGFSKC